jgi:hypothetical protein
VIGGVDGGDGPRGMHQANEQRGREQFFHNRYSVEA